MIDHLKRLTEEIRNHTNTDADIFGSYPEIYSALQELSPEQFEESWQSEFTYARAGYRKLVHPNKHEVITSTKVIDAAKRLRLVLDHYLGPKQTDIQISRFNTFNYIKGNHNMGDKINISGNVTGSSVGSNAYLKARDIITQVQQSELDDDSKQKFTNAAEALAKLNIAEGDKSDAADDMNKLRAELEKPTQDQGRIQKIWLRIQTVAPTVASILASATSLGKIAGISL